ncbi:MAG: helix-turn-helix domain-containing protein, partial [Planctomycetota bacterium]
MPRGDLVQSVGKALDLLELLGDAGELRLADLCERTGLKSPTAHNLVRTLASRGFVEKRPGGRYRVGPAVAALAERGRERGFQAAVRDTLRDLGHALPATTLTFAVVEHA